MRNKESPGAWIVLDRTGVRIIGRLVGQPDGGSGVPKSALSMPRSAIECIKVETGQARGKCGSVNDIASPGVARYQRIHPARR
jgi:hypothetical protein